MTAMNTTNKDENLECTNSMTLMNYSKMREIGRTLYNDSHHICDNLTITRMRPIISNTPLNCRSILCMLHNADNKLIAASHGDHTIGIYCANTSILLALCIGHHRSPWSLAFHPRRSDLLASGCLSGEIRIWNLAKLRNVSALDQADSIVYRKSVLWYRPGAIASLSFHPTLPFIAVAWAQEITFYDWTDNQVLSTWRFASDHSRTRWLQFNPLGDALYTGTANPPFIANNDNGLSELQGTASDSSSRMAAFLFNAGPAPEYPEGDCRGCIPRSHILKFIVAQAQDWFKRLGICAACTVRICRWAGTLGPVFPSVNTDTQQGWSQACRTACDINVRSQVSGAVSIIRNESKPAAVAIIEDMPAQEFLFSRGKYCNRNAGAVLLYSDDEDSTGLCCAAHGCDLILIHRELSRHSLCRPCLTAFWRWTSNYVSWWDWDDKTDLAKAPQNVTEPCSSSKDRCVTSEISVSYQFNESDKCVQIDERQKLLPYIGMQSSRPVGICHICHSNLMQSWYKQLSDQSSDTAYSEQEIPETIPANAIRVSLRPRQRELILRWINEHANNISSQLSNEVQSTVQTEERPPVTGPIHLGAKRKANTSENCGDNEGDLSNATPSTSGAPQIQKLANPRSVLPNEFLERFPPTQPASSVSVPVTQTSLVPPVANLQLSPHSGENQILWKTTALTTACCLCGHIVPSVIQLDAKSPLSRDVCERLILPELPNSYLDEDLRGAWSTDGSSIVSDHTVHPSNDNNWADSESESDADGISDDDAAADGGVFRGGGDGDGGESGGGGGGGGGEGEPGNSSRHQHRQGRNAVEPLDSGQSAPVTSSPHRVFSVSPSSREPGQRGQDCGDDTLRQAVHRSITSALTGLYRTYEDDECVDQAGTTFRICRWEVTLCGPIACDVECLLPKRKAADNEPGSSTKDKEQEKQRVAMRFMPMPANTAVSYNDDSLIIPHARITNPSAIAISKDGRMMAALVLTDEGMAKMKKVDYVPPDPSFPAGIDKILAVYQLEPKACRGRCLFTQCFPGANPVCLDFSPLGDYIAVGLGSTDGHHQQDILPIPLPPRPYDGDTAGDTYQRLSVNISPSALVEETKRGNFPIGHIFRLDRSVLLGEQQPRVRHTLQRVTDIRHPASLSPVSATSDILGQQQGLDRWHRILLATPEATVLNCIMWRPDGGGLYYGTAQGMLVMMRVDCQSEPQPLIDFGRSFSRLRAYQHALPAALPRANSSADEDDDDDDVEDDIDDDIEEDDGGGGEDSLWDAGDGDSRGLNDNNDNDEDGETEVSEATAQQAPLSEFLPPGLYPQ